MGFLAAANEVVWACAKTERFWECREGSLRGDKPAVRLPLLRGPL